VNVYKTFSGKMNMLPQIYTSWLDVLVSGDRINDFLLSEEIDMGIVDWDCPSEAQNKIQESVNQIPVDGKKINEKEIALGITDGNFFWVDPQVDPYLTAKKEKKEQEKNQKCCQRRPKKTKPVKTDLEEPLMRASIAETLSETVTDISPSKKNTEDQFGSVTQIQPGPETSPRKTANMTVQTNSNGNSLALQTPNPRLDICDINLSIPRGSCVAIIGKVGSGKSSLLVSPFSELYHSANGTQFSEYDSIHQIPNSKPKIQISGRVAYVSQKSWIRSQTIRENILFNLPYDELRYNNSIDCAGLRDDLSILPDEDLTMMGDKGVNLSGGQKIRLSIARAIYSDAEILLLDDPISALDIHVGQYVMEHGITG
jgi:ATP-binding cassette subfamily C (CFTR/MRP) protein 1